MVSLKRWVNAVLIGVASTAMVLACGSEVVDGVDGSDAEVLPGDTGTGDGADAPGQEPGAPRDGGRIEDGQARRDVTVETPRDAGAGTDSGPSPRDGGGLSDGSATGDGATCVDACTEGATQCGAGQRTVETCTRAPSACTRWVTSTTCSASLICTSGACAPACSSPCILGATRCLPSGQIERCTVDASGCEVWSAPQTCSSGQTCAAGGSTCSGGGVVSWRAVRAPTVTRLTDVFGTSPGDVWMTGDGGTLLHWDGATLTAASYGGTADLQHSYVAGPKEIWSVDGGSVARYNGSTWKLVGGGAVPSGLNGVAGVAPGVVMLKSRSSTGEQFYLFDGGVAVPAPQPSTAGKYFVMGTVAGEPWVMSEIGDIHVFRGGAWSKKPFLVAYNSVAEFGRTVSGPSETNFWILANASVPSYFYNVYGNGFFGSNSPGPQRIVGIHAPVSNSIWGVGVSGRIVHSTGGLFLQDNRFAAAPPSEALLAVWESAPDDVWAVGTGGTVLHLSR